MKKVNLLRCLLLALSCALSASSLAQTDITNLTGTATAQYTDSPTNEGITKLVDNQSSTKYLTFHASGWVQFQSTSDYVVTKYAITSANDAAERDPKGWTFQGSANGNTWVTLDTRNNEDFATRFLRREFSFTNATAYAYYRLQASNNSGNILQLAEWEIYGSVPTVATVYKHCDYSTSGYGVALAAGDYTTAQLTAKGIVNNDISSLKITSGYEILLFDQDNFLGGVVTLTGNVACLTNHAFNDRTSSLKVRKVSVTPSPTVSISSPSNNAFFTAPAAISITAVATDANSIQKVEFFNGSTKLGEDLTTPYTYSWIGVAVGTYTLTVKATNGSGLSTVSSPVAVTVTDPTVDPWANFQYPQIVFQDLSPTHPGSQIFHTAIADPQSAMRSQILALVKKLHYNAGDNIRSFTKLTYMIEDYDGVAEKWGGPPEIFIRVSTRHLQNIFNQTGGDYNAIRTEILGILSHEGTHGYQYEPKNAGAYDGNSDFYGFIEGLADYVRISVGLHPGRFASVGGSWKHGYTTSGFFIHWMVQKKDPNFAIKFQHTARTYATWSWDAACREILGVGVQPLWDEYQNWIRTGAAAAAQRGASYNNDMEQYTCVADHITIQEHVNTRQTEAAEEYVVVLENNTLIIQPKSQSEIREVELYYYSGVLAKSISGNTGIASVSDLSDGVYILMIHDSKGNKSKQKIVIQK